MAEKEKEEKKIIVDEDWKEQAQKEKVVAEPAAKAEGEKAEEQKQRGPLPPGNFAALISMLTTQVAFALGALVQQGEEKKEPDLEMAKYTIDMLAMLEAKTKDNLTEQEKDMLTNTLHQVRMLYVKVAEQKQ